MYNIDMYNIDMYNIDMYNIDMYAQISILNTYLLYPVNYGYTPNILSGDICINHTLFYFTRFIYHL